jgi:hypothetical protein
MNRIPTAALLIPLLAFRLLIPAGLMPVMSADGSLSMQVCPGTVPVASAHARHAMHHGSNTDDSNSTHAHHDGTSDSASSQETACPFSVLAESACTSCPAGATTLTMRHVPVPSYAVAQVCLATVIRPQEPRAPPRTV